jgi:hypothetical protein
MTVSAPGINFRGRFEFLSATQRHWPELLASLPKSCERSPTGAWPATFSELQSVLKHRECAQAILEWARRHSVEDEWILDAATQTVGLAGLGRWHYVPSSLPIPEFAPRFGVWLPSPTTPWSWFKNTTKHHFSRQLDEYRTTVARIWGVRKRGLEVHAGWTVLWQRGKSPEQIRIQHRRSTPVDVTVANIQISVAAFAQSIGLTLRASKSNRSRSM